jgi:hypothetical protein
METRLSPDDRDAGRPLASGLWATALLVLVLLIAGIVIAGCGVGA